MNNTIISKIASLLYDTHKVSIITIKKIICCHLLENPNCTESDMIIHAELEIKNNLKDYTRFRI
jgi:hypothetical protein